MIEHQKIVLNGVRSNKTLFKKELEKSLAWLSSQEQQEFKKWVLNQFKTSHSDILKEVLN